LEAWQERPLLGWGYYAYFQSPSAQFKHSSIPELKYYAVPHFHEAYIQTAVDLGVVGLIGLLAVLVSTILRSYRYSVQGVTRDGVSFFTMSIVLAVGGLAIYIFPSYNHFSTFLLFLLYFSMREHGAVASQKRREEAATESI
jgi:O-antigen ligase